ncbi:acylphosphatase [Pseudoxanthomonas kalamensis DSM 18571]|uniref:acylphosphatase n=1 Tax=Pseudoxanthomonas kalamensis TaxID=289483 RepID=UPI0013909C74|nr:acylphosphatase [Pseudoxanthomonas kalamensis]KAF1708787.1 acylphosphatase [Pseudoxanthomonas kalamensis DSM 18571]
MRLAARFIVVGRVQGVYYRVSTRKQALRLGLRGYAKNLADGSVEVLAIGDAAAIDALERWLWIGPTAAQVESVGRSNAQAETVEDGFVTI